MTNNLGRALKDRRAAKGLTQEQVSMLTGVSPAHIGRIESGDRFPSARILRKLAEPLGFSETEIFKLAGFLSRDDSDIRTEIKEEITRVFGVLCSKIDSL